MHSVRFKNIHLNIITAMQENVVLTPFQKQKLGRVHPILKLKISLIDLFNLKGDYFFPLLFPSFFFGTQ